jgi:hypothetical protein
MKTSLNRADSNSITNKNFMTKVEWNSFEKQIVLSPGPSHYILGLALKGMGTAWLDEVSVKPE